MTESEEQIIKVLEDIRDNLAKQEQRESERIRIVTTNQELAGANAKQYEDSQRAYRQSQEQYIKELHKPKLVALVLVGIIAVCQVVDLILRFLGR